MVLVDEKGVKIHATIKKQLLYLFQDKIVEGEVYKMTNFEVARNTGSYRTAVHEFKLNFLMRTKVQRAGALVISQNGFSFSKCSQIKSVKEEAVHLVDIIGLLSGVSAEKEYRRDGKIVKMVIIEITDDSGKVDCALFGEYVDILRKEMEKSGEGMPVIVVQFAKIKIFRENGSLQNVMNTTRLFVNPDFAEAVEFKEGLAVHGVESTCPIAVIQPRARISKEDDFLHMFPKKSIDGVKHCLEEGVFVVCGTIAGLVDGSDFSYLACKCHRKVVPDSGSYYCSNCDKHVYQVLPRFKVKVNVKDDVEECVLVLFDYDVHYLLGKTCVQVIEETKSGCGSGYPVELDALVGKRLLFKVERNLSSFSALDDSFKVKRVCDDLNIIQSFIQNGDNHTPAKSVATLPGELFSLSGVQSDPAGQSFVSDAIVTPDEIMANHGGEYSSLLGEKSGHGFESNVEDFVVDAIVTPPAVVNADIPLKFEKSKFTLGDDSDAVPLSFSDVAAPCVGDEIPRIADEGTIGLKRKLFSEFEELDDLDVKMPFKCVKIEKE